MHFKINIIKQALLVLLVVVMCGSCGYKFSGGGTLPSGTGVVCITIFNNRSSEAMFENTIANDLIYEFTRNGQKISKNEGDADSVMTGEVKSVSSETITRTGSLTSLESRVTISLLVQLKNRKGNILWENKNITDSEAYTVYSNNVVGNAAKKEALQEISERVASKIYAAMTEDF
jgi:outer membrane lipopolysaccharide assembly protein LptE/RlpB